MYHKWLDRWDERRAQRGNAVKEKGDFALDSKRAFPDRRAAHDIAAFCALAEHAVEDTQFFEGPTGVGNGFDRDGAWLRFHSDITTDVEKNNHGWANVTEGGGQRALVVFHHWNASSRQRRIAKFFARQGITTVEMALPYHFERSRPGALYADDMLSANLGQTVQSMRQAVLDGRKLIRWLNGEGYDEIAVLGMSLGSWAAGLVAAHDPAVSKASLFLTAGSLADMVWTGRATRSIRESLTTEIDLLDLRRAWAPLNLERYTDELARPNLDLQVILAKRDQVVLPEVSDRFLQALQGAGAQPDILRLNCGHYSMALPPHILFAGMRLKRFLGTGQDTGRSSG